MSQRSHRGHNPHSDSIADILERVLDTGVVVAGDIRVQLADIELLTIQIRLIICSVDRALELGIDWWRSAPFLTGDSAMDSAKTLPGQPAMIANENNEVVEDLGARMDRLERAILAMAQAQGVGGG